MIDLRIVIASLPLNAVDTEWENEEYPCYSCDGEGETEDEEYNDDTEEYETTKYSFSLGLSCIWLSILF